MSEQVIHINSLRWELETSTLDSARDWQEEVSKFSQEKIAGIVNESVQDHFVGAETIIIPSIELILPPLMNPDDISSTFEKVWNEALEEKLLEYVLVKKGVLQSDPSIDKSIIGQLLVFFKTGSLSWYSEKAKVGDKVELMRLLLDYPASEIAKLIQTVSLEKESIKRFIQLFNEEQLVQLLQHANLDDDFSRRLLKIVDGIFKKSFASWENHNYRKFILFSLLTQKIRGEILGESHERILSSWWSTIIGEHYFLPGEISGMGEVLRNRTLSKNEIVSVVDEVEQLVISVVLKEIKESGGTWSQVGENIEDMKAEAQDLNSMTGRSYFIENAGIILLYPCLKNWFREENLLNEHNEFNNYRAQMEATRLLQYICLGSNDFMEYHLVLNKILCGYPLDRAIYGEQNIIEKNKEYTDRKILELLGGWEKLKNTSADVFRTSFLIRNGKLTEEDDHYFLRVDSKGLDALLGSYPFPKNIIKLPWMVKPLYTEW